ncbi:MAG: hypothetical protein ACOYN8_01330 [Pseudanabaena sp.]|jgi:hypothetical protein
MNQLIVQIVDKNKAEMLSKFLTALDFVKSVEIQEQRETEINNEQDFFALAGLWKDRACTVETIRQQAWQENI